MQTRRHQTVKNILKQNNLDAALISSLSNIVYLTDFYYFSDLEREAFLLITAKNNFIFTDARYSHAVKNSLKNYTLLEISAQNSFIKLLESVIKKEKINSLGIEENNLTVHEHKQLTPFIKTTKHFDLNTLRMIKDENEIEAIKQACSIGDKMFEYILKKVKLGITEKEVAFLVESFFRNEGCEPSFPTIVAFQENAAIPHHKTSDRKLKKNELVLIDSGVKYNEYCSDMTRTFFAGKATKEQQNVYETVLNSQQEAINYIRKQLEKKQTVSAKFADKASRDYITKNNYPAYAHGLGHGVGLQVHEPPRLSPLSKEILTDGMVFSIEPGIYLPDEMGVRIEDLFTIQNGALIPLTKSSNELITLKI